LLVTAPVARAQDAAADFHRFDRNGDGKLTREECPPDLRAQFDRVDTTAFSLLFLSIQCEPRTP
jgi:hypothetical protein